MDHLLDNVDGDERDALDAYVESGEEAPELQELADEAAPLSGGEGAAEAPLFTLTLTLTRWRR